MTPSSSSALITSPDFRRIFSASSPTVTDSGTRMSSRFTSAGGAGGASTAAAGRAGAGADAAGWAGRDGAASAAGRGTVVTRGGANGGVG